MIRRPPRSTQGVSSAASDVYKRQDKYVVYPFELHPGIYDRKAGMDVFYHPLGPVHQLLVMEWRGTEMDYYSAHGRHPGNANPCRIDCMRCFCGRITEVPTFGPCYECYASGQIPNLVLSQRNAIKTKEAGFTMIAKCELHDWRPMNCLLYTSPSPRDGLLSRMPSSA